MSYILVVDDEKDIRDLISQILFEEGHTVKLAHNSTSAIDYINNEEPDLIILDIWLKDSEMDGIITCPNSIYMRDIAGIMHDGIILGNPKYDIRKPEKENFSNFLDYHNYKGNIIDTNSDFEGDENYVSYFIGDGTYNCNTMAGISSLTASSVVTQDISLDIGWNIWSTYVDPEDPNMASMWAFTVSGQLLTMLHSVTFLPIC